MYINKTIVFFLTKKTCSFPLRLFVRLHMEVLDVDLLILSLGEKVNKYISKNVAMQFQYFENDIASLSVLCIQRLYHKRCLQE